MIIANKKLDSISLTMKILGGIGVVWILCLMTFLELPRKISKPSAILAIFLFLAFVIYETIEYSRESRWSYNVTKATGLNTTPSLDN